MEQKGKKERFLVVRKSGKWWNDAKGLQKIFTY